VVVAAGEIEDGEMDSGEMLVKDPLKGGQLERGDESAPPALRRRHEVVLVLRPREQELPLIEVVGSLHASVLLQPLAEEAVETGAAVGRDDVQEDEGGGALAPRKRALRCHCASAPASKASSCPLH
jgi:hypothetical protein